MRLHTTTSIGDGPLPVRFNPGSGTPGSGAPFAVIDFDQFTYLTIHDGEDAERLITAAIEAKALIQAADGEPS